MSSALILTLSLIAGVGIGAAYIYTLWLTVERLPRVKNPAAFLLISFGLRMGLVLVGFYFVMGGSWTRLLACLTGFVVARMYLTRQLGMANVSERILENMAKKSERNT